jgi:hypothetical protein
MKIAVVVVCLFAVAFPAFGQNTTGPAQTNGPCSPATSGNSNTFKIDCAGISKEQGKQMLDILNKILANQLNDQEVNTKLDELLKASRASSLGNLKSRAMKLSDEILDDLYRNGYSVRVPDFKPRSQQMNTPPDHSKKEFANWNQMMLSNYGEYYEAKVLQVRDDFARIGYRDDTLESGLEQMKKYGKYDSSSAEERIAVGLRRLNDLK